MTEDMLDSAEIGREQSWGTQLERELGVVRQMKIKFDSIVTLTLVVCAVITTGVVLRREFTAPAAGRRQVDQDQKDALIARWRDDLSKGIRLGPDAAPVQLIEFADFECPFCGDFHTKLKALRARYPTQVSLTYVHFPLPGHRFALPAARVAECAGEQGRFEAMYDQLFEGQGQFGLKPWDDYAIAAGVLDIAAFDVCTKKTDSMPRVEAGKALGAKLDIQGTPTVIINGWKLGHPPTAEELDQMVQRILAGKSPVDGKS
jgi:protein-disulfide isomerase